MAGAGRPGVPDARPDRIDLALHLGLVEHGMQRPTRDGNAIMGMGTPDEATRPRCIRGARVSQGRAWHERVERELGLREVVLVPWLFWSEVVNVRARRHRWPGSQVLGVPLDRDVLMRASEPFPTLVGTLDAIHLASAILVRRRFEGLIMTTHDAELALAARAEGFEVQGE